MFPASVQIFVCTHPQDMRRSFDELAAATREVLGKNPQSGALFAFINKRGNRVKVLWWDRNGYCLLYKRLHRALFRIPAAREGDDGISIRIDGRELARLLEGVSKETRVQSLTGDRR